MEHFASINSEKPDKEGLKRNLFIRVTIYGTLFLVLLTICLLAIFFHLKRTYLDEFEKEQITLLDTLSKEVDAFQREIRADLFYLTDSPYSLRFLEKGDNPSEQVIVELIESILNYKSAYNHIQIIDSAGDEMIRINDTDQGSPVIVDKDDLQDKSGCYYFREISGSPSKEIYISDFDLNVELNEIVMPPVPTIRFARQILNEKGNIAGIGVINYNGRKLYERLLKYVDTDRIHFFLTNKEGYYLYHENREKQFSFMFSREDSFVRDYPDIWSKRDRGNFWTDRDGFFFLTPVNPGYRDGRTWYAVLYADPDQLEELDHLLKTGITIGLAFLVPLLLILSYLLARSHEKNLMYHRELERLARIDSMTGLFNLREIKNRLNYTASLSSRSGKELTIAFIDVNNLKFFNDNYGHHYGDTLIKAAAVSIRNHIRTTDSASRIGGDEFLIVFPTVPWPMPKKSSASFTTPFFKWEKRKPKAFGTGHSAGDAPNSLRKTKRWKN